MLQISIIVFREILEIALVISILIAATKDIKGRNKWIIYGIVFGILGSILLAIFTGNISESLDGVGLEIFNASILLTSSLMIAWTVIWMSRNAHKVSSKLKEIGQSVADGNSSLISLVPVVAFAVLREGAEIVLFSYGSFASGNNIADLIFGAICGLTLGIIAGFGLYFGLLKVLGKHFFSVTSWLLILLAAGMVSQSIGLLSSANIVPEIIYPLWDSSFLISEQGFLGKVLHALFGYITKPSAAQIIGYAATVSLLFIGLHYKSNTKPKRS